MKGKVEEPRLPAGSGSRWKQGLELAAAYVEMIMLMLIKP